MISDNIAFPADDSVELLVSQWRWANAVITDVGGVDVTSVAGTAYQEGMVKVAACLKSRLEATLDMLEPEWRLILQTVAELTGGQG
jgi:hypothetical protein